MFYVHIKNEIYKKAIVKIVGMQMQIIPMCNFFCILWCSLQSMCLQFINALLAQTDDLEFRMHLRNEIVRNGLFDKFGES